MYDFCTNKRRKKVFGEQIFKPRVKVKQHKPKVAGNKARTTAYQDQTEIKDSEIKRKKKNIILDRLIYF